MKEGRKKNRTRFLRFLMMKSLLTLYDSYDVIHLRVESGRDNRILASRCSLTSVNSFVREIESCDTCELVNNIDYYYRFFPTSRWIRFRSRPRSPARVTADCLLKLCVLLERERERAIIFVSRNVGPWRL